MAKLIGRRISVGLGRETNRGVGVPASHWIPFVSFSFDDKANVVDSGEGLGNIYNAADSFVTEQWAEGDFEGEINSESFGLILLGAFGTVSSATDTPEAGVNTHTYTLQSDNQHDSLSLYVDDPNGDLLFELTMLNTLSVEIAPNEIVKFTANFMSKRSVDTTCSPSFATNEKKFTGRDLELKIADTTAGLSGASAISVKSLSFEIAKNVERDFPAGTLQAEDILNKNFDITGSIELNYEDRTYRDYMLNGDKKAMGIKLTGQDTIGTSSHPEFYLELPRVRFDTWESSRGLDDIVSQTINFRALVDLSNSEVISNCYLINTTTSY